MPQSEKGLQGRPYTLIPGTFTTVPKIRERVQGFVFGCCFFSFYLCLVFLCDFFIYFFTSGIKSEYQNSLRIYIHHILVKHTPILKSRLTIFAFVKWLELG